MCGPSEPYDSSKLRVDFKSGKKKMDVLNCLMSEVFPVSNIDFYFLLNLSSFGIYTSQIKPGTLVYASKTHTSTIPRGLVGKVKRADDADFGKGIFIDWGAFGAAEGKDISASPEPPVFL